MKNKQVRMVLAIGMALCLAQAPLQASVAEKVPLGKVVPQGPAELNQTPLLAESTVYTGDIVSTGAQGQALVFLGERGQVQVGPASEVRLTETEKATLATLERGTLRARSGRAKSLLVWAHGLLITPQGPARYHVALTEKGTVVSTEQGTVRVQGDGETYTVAAGEAMQFEVALAPEPVGAGVTNGLSPRAKILIGLAVAGGVAAIAIPLALREEEEVVSPSVP